MNSKHFFGGNDGKDINRIFFPYGRKLLWRTISKGNTAVAAEFAQKAVGGDLFEIRTVKEYPVNYKQCTDIAAEEDRTNARPELRGTLPDMSGYNTIITKYAVLYKYVQFQKRHGCRWFQSEATF